MIVESGELAYNYSKQLLITRAELGLPKYPFSTFNHFTMLLRIVRMEFQPEKVADFLTIFDKSKQLIRSFPGCTYLALHTDATNPNVRYTYSKWESKEALGEYRKSELFTQTWAATKILFSAKPQVFSLYLEEEIGE